MPLSKLLPSRALFRKDWRQTLPIFLVFTSFITFVSTLTLAQTIVSYRAVSAWWQGGPWPGFSAFHRLLESSSGPHGLIMVLFAIIIGVEALGYEREKGTLSVLLSMPYSRRDILRSKVAVALLQIGLPFVANAFLMTLLMGANGGVGFPFGVAAVWSWAGHSVVVLIFVLCISLLASTVSGKILGAAFLALVLLSLPLGIYRLVAANGMHWEATGFLPLGIGMPWYWQGSMSEIATFLSVPTWLMYFPAVLAGTPGGVTENIWQVLRDHIYASYLVLVAVSFGLYLLAQKWFARTELERDGELLALPSLRSTVSTGFIVCSSLLGGAYLPTLVRPTHNNLQLAVLLLSYGISAVVAWTLTKRFLGANTGTEFLSQSEIKRKGFITTLFLVGAVVVVVVLAALFGVTLRLTDAQVNNMLALADAVMERRTAALVSPSIAPVTRLRTALAVESPELLRREEALIVQLKERREQLRQQGEAYSRTEIELTLTNTLLGRGTATITAFEHGKAYFLAAQPKQPEYTAWLVSRQFFFVRQGEMWELTEHRITDGKGLPLNEPSDKTTFVRSKTGEPHSHQEQSKKGFTVPPMAVKGR